MASSFIYRPHVHNLDNVSTPDVLIDHLSIFKGNETTSVPIDRITTNVEIQVVGDDTVPDAAIALVGAGAGTLLSIASNHGSRNEPASRLSCVSPLSRQAWRLNDIEDHAAEMLVRTFAIDENGTAMVQEGNVGKFFSSIKDDTPLGNIQLLTGLNLDMENPTINFKVEIEDPVLSRKLSFQYWVEEI